MLNENIPMEKMPTEKMPTENIPAEKTPHAKLPAAKYSRAKSFIISTFWSEKYSMIPTTNNNIANTNIQFFFIFLSFKFIRIIISRCKTIS